MDKVVRFKFENGDIKHLTFPRTGGLRDENGARPISAQPLFQVDLMSDIELEWWFKYVLNAIHPSGKVLENE